MSICWSTSPLESRSSISAGSAARSPNSSGFRWTSSAPGRSCLATRTCSTKPSRCDAPIGEKVLADLLDSAEAGAELVARGRAAFDEDRLLRLAGGAVVGRIGEAARKLLAAFGEELPQDIPWSDAVGARIIVDHAYHRVDYDVIWSTSSGTSPRWPRHSPAGQPNATSRSSGSSSQPEIDPEVWPTSRRVDLNPADLIPPALAGTRVAIQQMRRAGVFEALPLSGRAGEFGVHASQALGGPIVFGIPSRSVVALGAKVFDLVATTRDLVLGAPDVPGEALDLVDGRRLSSRP